MVQTRYPQAMYPSSQMRAFQPLGMAQEGRPQGPLVLGADLLRVGLAWNICKPFMSSVVSVVDVATGINCWLILCKQRLMHYCDAAKCQHGVRTNTLALELKQIPTMVSVHCCSLSAFYQQ